MLTRLQREKLWPCACRTHARGSASELSLKGSLEICTLLVARKMKHTIPLASMLSIKGLPLAGLAELCDSLLVLLGLVGRVNQRITITKERWILS